MVRDDGLYPDKVVVPSPEEPALETRLAAPIDRAAAFVADMILFVPIAAVLISPIRKHALEAKLLDQHELWMQSLASTCLVTLIAAILYQTVFTAFLGATPGKRFMRLRVISLWEDRKLRPMEAFVRSVVWCLDVVTLAPLAAVFGNEMRRPLHDRAGDSVVVIESKQKRTKPAGAPTLAEMSIASGFQGAVLTVLAILSVTQLLHPSVASSELIASLEADGKLCREVSEAHNEWAEGPTRLNVALALFNAQSLDESCLRQEADFALWNNDEKTLAYLAKGLAEPRDHELQEKYFDRACPEAGESSKANDPICAMVEFAESSGENVAFEEEGESAAAGPTNRIALQEGVTDLEPVVASLTNESPSYLKIAVVRHFMAAHQYKQALQLIDETPSQKRLGFFLARERAKALWQTGQLAESRAAFKTSIDLLGPSRRMELAQWFCSAETAGGICREEGRAPCQAFAEVVDRQPELLSVGGASATLVRAEVCTHEGHLDEEWETNLTEMIPEKSGRQLVHAVHLAHAPGRTNDALKVLNELATSRDDDDAFYLEANLQLVDLAKTEADLEPIRTRWLSLSQNSESWREMGLSITARLGAFGAWEEALTTGLKLVQPGESDRQLFKVLVVTAYRAGREGMAAGFLNQIKSLEPERIRMPASSGGVEDYERVAQTLSTHASRGKK